MNIEIIKEIAIKIALKMELSEREKAIAVLYKLIDIEKAEVKE